MELSLGQCLRGLHFSPTHPDRCRVWLARSHALPVAQIWSRRSHRRPMLFRAGRSCAHDPLREVDFLGDRGGWRKAKSLFGNRVAELKGN